MRKVEIPVVYEGLQRDAIAISPTYLNAVASVSGEELSDDNGIIENMQSTITAYNDEFQPVIFAATKSINEDGEVEFAYDFGSTEQVLECRGAVLNTSDASLTYQGEKIELTKNEWRILQVLMEHKGKAVSRDTLMMRLWESDSFIDDNTLTVNVARLRKKMEQIGLSGKIITKKGIGYMVEA